MTELETLQTYENWKQAKSKRKFWIKIIAILGGLILAYISASLLTKNGLTGIKKSFPYWLKKTETKEERDSLPADYTTWYKEKGMENNWFQKKFGHSPTPYHTYGEIAKRQAEKEGKKLLGDLGGEIAKWLTDKGLDESKKNEVDQISYAHEVYSNAAFGWIVSLLFFWLIAWLLLRYLVLPLSWKEPKLTEEEKI